MTKPFRWTIAKREQLGGLIEDMPDRRPLGQDLLGFIRDTAARVLATAEDSDLAFIGRTPENFYDYLSGVFSDMEDAPRLHLVQFSLRGLGAGGVEALPTKSLAGLFDYFTQEGVNPAAIARASRPLALVDLVAGGGTIESLVTLLKEQAAREGMDWNAVQRRLRIVGLISRGKTSPNTWRWQQHQDWRPRSVASR
jgi:hypothetical protein